jgi:alpha-tubulin suppressor-like RCC1 family protein
LTVGGQVFCWGANDRGQLGSGATVDSHTPIAVTGVANAVAIAAGNKFACALIVNGTLRCWGDNSAGQLGDGGAEAFSPTPIFVPSLSVAVALTAGANHACVLAPSGRVFCWGANSRGQMGNNSIQPAPFVVLVQGITDAVSISAGAFFTCAARAGGTASCWGSNDSGELSSIDSADHLTPTAVGTSRFCIFCPGGKAFVSLTGVVAITTGTSTSLPTKQQACALLVTGVIDCWGDNSQGEVGDGSTTNPPRPTAVNSFAANIDPAADLRNGRIAEVTALVDCEVDGRAHIILSLEQGAVSGSGQAEARCEDRLLRVPMTVPAHGPAGFQAGPATAHVEAIVRSDGRIVEDTHWIREVTISVFN